MNTTDLDQLEAKLAAATPGEWCGALLFTENHTEANYDLIDALKNAAPSLISTARERDELKAERDACWEELRLTREIHQKTHDLLCAQRDEAQSAREDLQRQVDCMREAACWFVTNRTTIMQDISSAHSGRGNGASQWMREDDAEFRRDLREAFDKLAEAALSQAKGGEG